MPTWPSHAGATSEDASPEYTTFSGDTTRTWSVATSAGLLHLLGGLDHLFDAALHVEGLLREVVELARGHALERLDRRLELHVAALDARELLGHVERLRQEPLQTTRAVHDDLVFFG